MSVASVHKGPLLNVRAFLSFLVSEKTVMEAKLGFYRAHEHNRCVLIIRQDSLEVAMHLRRADGTWPAEPVVLRAADDAIVLEDLGRICTVGDLYTGTPLDPQRTLRAER